MGGRFDRFRISGCAFVARTIRRAVCVVRLFGALGFHVFGIDADDSLDVLVGVQGDDVDDWNSAGVSGRVWAEFVGLEGQDSSSAGEEEEDVVGIDDEDVPYWVVVSHVHSGYAFAAAVLGAEGCGWDAFDVAALAEGDDDLFVRFYVVAVDVDCGVADLRAADAVEFLLERAGFLLDLQIDLVGVSEQVFQSCDRFLNLSVLGLDLLSFEGGEASELHVQDRLGLLLVEIERGHEAVARGFYVRGAADELDDCVDLIESDEQPSEDVRAGACFSQLELCAPSDDLASEFDVVLQGGFDGQELRLALDEGANVCGECLLHLGQLVQVVQDDHSLRAAAQLHDDAHSPPVGFVSDFGDAVESLVLDEGGDLFDQSGLVDLERELGNDDLHTVAALHWLDLRHCADHDCPPSCRIRILDAAASHDRGACGEVWAGYHRHQVLVGRIWMVDEVDDSVAKFRWVMRGNVGRHAHGDACGAVDEEVWEPGWEDDWFLQRAVEVVREIDRFLIEVCQHFLGCRAQPCFRVAHRRRGVVVDAAKIPLSVDQRHAQGEVLRQAHHCIVDRALAVGVVLAEDVTYQSGALAVRGVRAHSHFVRGVQDAALHRLEAVAHIRQRAPNDDRHGVGEIRASHLLLETVGSDVSKFGARYHLLLLLRPASAIRASGRSPKRGPLFLTKV